MTVWHSIVMAAGYFFLAEVVLLVIFIAIALIDKRRRDRAFVEEIGTLEALYRG